MDRMGMLRMRMSRKKLLFKSRESPAWVDTKDFSWAGSTALAKGLSLGRWAHFKLGLRECRIIHPLIDTVLSLP